MSVPESHTDVFATKRYRLPKNIDPREFPTLPQIVTLMMFKDSILSSYRWYDSLRDKHGVEVLADLTFSIACGAGWAAEAIRLLKDLKNEGVITEDLLRKLPAQQPINPKTVWDDCVESGSAVMNRLHGIRDAGFAHFYNRKETEKPKRYALAYEAIEALAKGEIDVPFVEWTEQDGKKRNLESCAPFAMTAIVSKMYGITRGSLPENHRESGKQVLKIGILLHNLLDVMVPDAGIKCEPYEPTTEH